MSDENSNETTTSTTSAIDAAINKVRAAKASGEKPAKKARIVQPKAEKTEATSKRPRLTDEQKAAREQEKQTARAAKKAEREARKAAKAAERAANKKPAHMQKVQKAAARLPSLGETAQRFLGEVTVNLSASELTALALHIQHFNRVKATERALSQKVEAGASVRIVGGDPRFVGQTGTVSKAQRIRCYVEVPGAKKPVYLFTSDVEVLSAASATGTNG